MNKVTEISLKYKEIMDLLGIEENEDNRKTHERVAKALIELFENDGKTLDELDERMAFFPNDGYTEDFVEVTGIPYTSMCAHHHLPFFGKATVRYIPGENVVGLSKIPRVVKWFSKMPQIQEKLTSDIGKYLVERLHPVELQVELTDSVHTCMLCRGVQSEGYTNTKYSFKQRSANKQQAAVKTEALV